MISPQQWQELLEAIRAIAPSPFAPLLTGVFTLVGVALGFGLSALREALLRRRERREYLASNVERGRRAAVDGLSSLSVQMIGAWEFLHSAKTQAEIFQVSDRFLVTGDARDDVLREDSRRFLEALRSSLSTWHGTSAWGTQIAISGWDEREDLFRDVVSNVRRNAQVWVDHRRPGGELSGELRTATKAVADLKARTD